MPSPDPGKQTKNRPSTTGAVNPYGANQGNWRQKLQASRLKFGDEEKQTFLRTYVETGAIGMSARAANVSVQTVRDHEKNDPDFAEGFQEARLAFNEKLEETILKLAIKGEEKLHIGRVGKDEDGIIARQRQINMQALQMEAKRRNKEYTDRATVDMNVKGAPLYVPADLSVEEWKKLFGKPKPDSADAT